MEDDTHNNTELIKDGHSVLIISHKQTEINSIHKLLEASGHGVLSCGDAESAVDILCNNDIKTVLVNSGIRSPSCDEFVDMIIRIKPGLPLILTDVMSLSGSDTVLRSVRKGIFDFIMNIYDSEQLLISVGRAIQHYHRGKAIMTGVLSAPDKQFHPENDEAQQAIYIKKRSRDEQ